jgi:hypothetical protein
VRRSSYQVSDGSLDRTTGTNAHQAPQKAPHTLLIIQHTQSLYSGHVLSPWLFGCPFRGTPAATTTGRTGNSPGFGVAQEWWEWRRWLHWWAGVELPPMVPAAPNEVRDATSSYLI